MFYCLLIAIEEKNLINCTLIFDNVRLHKNSECRDLISSKDHKMMFLPPNTPDFNPIENMFAT